VLDANAAYPYPELNPPEPLPRTDPAPTAVFKEPLLLPVPTVIPDIVALLEDVNLLIVPAVKLHEVPNDPENVPVVEFINPEYVPVLELINPEYVPPVSVPVRVLAVSV
jgi:hypothetical protein